MASVKKKIQSGVNDSKEKTSRKQKQQQVSRYEAEFMAILRSQKLSLREIAQRVGYSPKTVMSYTQHVDFVPKSTDLNLCDVIRSLAMKTALDSSMDKGTNGKEYADTIERYFRTLEKIEGLRQDISLRDEILTIERMIENEELSDDVLESLQKRKKRLNDELKA